MEKKQYFSCYTIYQFVVILVEHDIKSLHLLRKFRSLDKRI